MHFFVMSVCFPCSQPPPQFKPPLLPRKSDSSLHHVHLCSVGVCVPNECNCYGVNCGSARVCLCTCGIGRRNVWSSLSCVVFSSLLRLHSDRYRVDLCCCHVTVVFVLLSSSSRASSPSPSLPATSTVQATWHRCSCQSSHGGHVWWWCSSHTTPGQPSIRFSSSPSSVSQYSSSFPSTASR